MLQSLARLHFHLIFSTKGRKFIISESLRDSLNGYLAGFLQNLGCPSVFIKSVQDHIHVLFELGRTQSVSRAVEEVRKSSSKWIKTQETEFVRFARQAGYGAFAVSESKLPAVRRYVAEQRGHHRSVSFQDEYRDVWAVIRSLR